MSGMNRQEVEATVRRMLAQYPAAAIVPTSVPITALRPDAQGAWDKGELPVAGSSGRLTTLAAAAGDGYDLTSDANEAAGVKWQVKPFHVISERATRYSPAGIGTTPFVIGSGGAANYYATSGSVAACFRLDPSDWGPNGVTLRLRAYAFTEAANPTDSTLNAQIGLLSSLGAGGTISGASAVTALASCAMAPNNPQLGYTDSSDDVTVTAAGWYFVVFVHTVNPATPMSYGYTVLGRPA